MTSEDATLAMIAALDAAAIPYMIVGSLSSNFYGVARSSHDADFVIQLGDIPISRLTDRLGADFSVDPQLSFESVTGTIRHVIRVPAADFTIEVFLLSADPHDQERFRRRRETDLYGHRTYLASAEDVVIMKLRWVGRVKRRKDIEDVENVLAVQRDHLDLNYVREWCDQHGTRQLLEDALSRAPQI